ncbi:hypothetical protein ACOMHN_063509 [Nucella lapillus]
MARNLKAVDCCALKQYLTTCLFSLTSSTLTAATLDSVMTSVLDDHAPATRCKVSARTTIATFSCHRVVSRTTIATVSSRQLTGSETDKLGRHPGGLPKHGLLPAGLSSLWDGQHHFPVQGQDDVLPLRTATMQQQTLATLQEFSLGGYGGSLTSDVCRLEGSSCQLPAVATLAILTIKISLTCYSREPRDP